MSVLVSDNGQAKTYAVADAHTKTLIAGASSIQEAVRLVDRLHKDGHQDVVQHNLTHQKCPDWLQAIAESDSDYCTAKAEAYDKLVASTRQQITSLQTELTRLQGRAEHWRELASAVRVQASPTL